MTRNTEHDPDQPHEPDAGTRLAAFLRELQLRLAAREEANPPPPPPEPWVDKPGSLIAAEKDVWRWELVEKITLLRCGGPAACAQARYRRSRRCAEMERLAPQIEASRATLAAEQARWTPPPAPPEPTPGKRRRLAR